MCNDLVPEQNFSAADILVSEQEWWKPFDVAAQKHKENQIPVVIVCRYCKRNRGDIATESEAAWLKVRRAVEGLPLKEDEAKEVSPYQTREKTERER